VKKLVLSSMIALAISLPSFANDMSEDQLQQQIRAEQASFDASMKASMEKMQGMQNPADYQAMIAEQRQVQDAHVAKMRELMQSNTAPAQEAEAPAPMMSSDMPAPLTDAQLDAHRKAVMDAQNSHMEAMKAFMGKVQAAKTAEERSALNKEYDDMINAHLDNMKAINDATYGKAPAAPATKAPAAQ
jgi:hypothetical protein